jgi:hypothetical protein
MNNSALCFELVHAEFNYYSSSFHSFIHSFTLWFALCRTHWRSVTTTATWFLDTRSSWSVACVNLAYTNFHE